MTEDNDLRPEYKPEDLGQGIRGKYYNEVQAGTNLILLDPDVASAFPDAKIVNELLRAIKNIAERSSNQPKNSS